MHSFPYTRDPAMRSHHLRSGISLLALALTLGATGFARAATYSASNHDELVSAIAAANADGDATSTITLTANISIVGNELPEVTKNLSINIAGNVLTSAGPITINVGAGAELAMDGSLRVLQVPNGSGSGGRLVKDGEGTLTITGGPSTYAWYIVANTGDIVIKDGATVTFDSRTAPGASQSTARSSVTVTGTGTVVRDLGGAALGTAGGATLNILAGAHYINGASLRIGYDTGNVATANVKGDGSLLQGNVQVARGLGILNVTEGAHVESTSTLVGGVAIINDQGGTAQFLVSGAGSQWENSGTFTFMRGSLDVLDGGVVETSIMRMATVGGSAQNAAIRVSGAGSEFITTSAVANAFQLGAGTGAKQASLTIANGGKVTVGSGGAGVVNMATSASSRAMLNIGGAEGEAATAAGTIDAGKLVFGPGTSVVNFNHTDSAYAFDVALDSNALPNNGTLNEVGSGKTVLTANQAAFTGKSNVLAGILEVNGTLGGTMDVLGGRLAGNGTVGATRNAAGGTIAPGIGGIGTLIVDGDYTSDGGALAIEAELGGDSSRTDMLVITGASILGTGATQVFVTNLGGLGAETVGDGIKIVDVVGASGAGAFALGGPAIGGAHRYELFQNDLLGTLDDGDWYLRAAGLAPTIPVYENYPQVLLGMIALPTLEQRIGDRHRAAMGAGDADATGIWTRIEGAHGHVESGASTSGASYDADTALVQVGLDAELWQGASGVLVGGLTAQYLRASADISSNLGDGGNDTDSFGVGATLTWYGQGGFYVDAQAQIASLDSDLSAAGVGSIGDGIDGNGYALSLEAGREIVLGDGWSLTPQAQLAWSSVDFDSFTDRFGADVSLRDGDSLKGRVGIAAGYEAGPAGTKVYGIANLTYEFLDGTGVVVSGVDAFFEPQRFGGELGVGGAYRWAGGKYALHGEVLGSSSFEGSYGVKGTAGLAMNF